MGCSAQQLGHFLIQHRSAALAKRWSWLSLSPRHLTGVSIRSFRRLEAIDEARHPRSFYGSNRFIRRHRFLRFVDFRCKNHCECVTTTVQRAARSKDCVSASHGLAAECAYARGGRGGARPCLFAVAAAGRTAPFDQYGSIRRKFEQAYGCVLRSGRRTPFATGRRHADAFSARTMQQSASDELPTRVLSTGFRYGQIF